MSCYSAAAQGVFVCLFPPPGLIWSFELITKETNKWMSPSSWGLGSCRRARCKECHCLAAAVVTPLGWLMDEREVCEARRCASNCQETGAGAAQKLTQISSRVSRRAMTLLWRLMRWLVIWHVCACTHLRTCTHFQCRLLIRCVCSLPFQPVNTVLKIHGIIYY